MFAFRFLICYIYVNLGSWKSFKNLKNQALVCYLFDRDGFISSTLFHYSCFIDLVRYRSVFEKLCWMYKRKRERVVKKIKFPVLKIEVTHVFCHHSLYRSIICRFVISYYYSSTPTSLSLVDRIIYCSEHFQNKFYSFKYREIWTNNQQKIIFH